MSDIVKHIRQTHADRLNLSWCGQKLVQEWAFTNIDHAAYSQEQESRHLVCKSCVKAVIKALQTQIKED